jgi:hypothetical protein
MGSNFVAVVPGLSPNQRYVCQAVVKICSDDLMIINFDDASAGDAVAICCDSALKQIQFALRYFEILRVIQNDSDLVLTEID